MFLTMNIIHVEYYGAYKRSMIQDRGAVSQELTEEARCTAIKELNDDYNRKKMTEI